MSNTIKEPKPEDRVINARYSYTKQYDTLREGIEEVFGLVPLLKESIFNPSINYATSFASVRSDEVVAQAIFKAATENILADFPSIYDDIYPATLALSITGDRFFYRSKNRVSLIWEYDRSFRETGIILINITVQFKEPTNKLRSKIFTDNIEELKKAGYVYNGAFDEHNSRRRARSTPSQEQDE